MNLSADWAEILPSLEGTPEGEAIPYGDVVISAGGPTGATLRLCIDGKVYINGCAVTTDAEIVDGLKEFLAKALDSEAVKLAKARRYYLHLHHSGHFGNRVPEEQKFVDALMRFDRF